MPSLNEITTGLAAHFDKQTDEPFKRFLAPKVNFWRSKLVVNSLEKHPEQRKFFRQTIWLSMEEDDLVDCPIPMTLCRIASSKFEVPRPMRVGDILFDYVGAIDGKVPFREAAPGMIGFMTEGRYSRNTTFYEYWNDKIKVRAYKSLPKIRVDGVFDDPIAVMEFNCRNSGQCDWWNEEYPITGDMLQMVVQYILQVDFNRSAMPITPEVEVNKETQGPQ
jgi:hypothetical protein